MATARETWKAFERRVAVLFGARRQVGSGSLGREDRGRSDTTHEHLFIEAKLRANCAVRSLFEATRVLARREGKVPVLALAKKSCHGFLIVFHSDDLPEFLRAVSAAPGEESK